MFYACTPNNVYLKFRNRNMVYSALDKYNEFITNKKLLDVFKLCTIETYFTDIIFLLGFLTFTYTFTEVLKLKQ